MKFSSLQENLKQGLFVVGHIARKNINLPILSNLMVRTGDSNIELVATNLEIGITHKIRGKIEQKGVFTVDSKIITDYISLLPNKKINIEKSAENLLVECENHKTKIKGQSAEDFPLIPSVNKDLSYSANIEEFKKALSQVVFAVSASESRMELSGVFFGFNNNKLTLAATDSYRLAEKEIKVKSSDPGNGVQNIIVPAKTLQELIRILSGLKDGGDIDEDNEEINFYISDNQILFIIKSTEIVSKLIEGQYPDYKQIIPAQGKTLAVVKRTELIRAVKASALFSKTGINDVNLDFPKNKGLVIVSSASGQTGESVINIEAKVSGEDNGIIVNYYYLLDGLNNIEDENIKIEVIDNNTPCILRPDQNSANNYLYIIMPIKQ